MQIDYLQGMIRSEAIAYIQSLPGLTRDEFFDLMNSAEKKPVSRVRGTDTSQMIEVRMMRIVTYIRSHHRATRRTIQQDLKINGSNIRYALAEALERGLIYVTRDGKEKVYKPAIGRKQ